MDSNHSANYFTPVTLSDRNVLIALTVFLFGFIYFSFFAPIGSIIYFISDDAYYYFKVAQNITTGLGPTFDSYNTTNGFHPLWMVILLPIFALTQNEADLALRLVISFQGILAFLSLWLCWLYVTKFAGKTMGAVSLLLFLLWASPVVLLFNGLESGLLIFWTFLLLSLDQKFHLLDNNARLGKRFLLGCILGVFVLIRLDSAFFVIAMVILKLIWFCEYRNFWQKIINLVIFYLPSGIACILFLSPYFAWNLMNFEHLTPVSGALKSSFPAPILQYHFSTHTLPYVFPFLAIFVWVICSSWSQSGYLRNHLFPLWPTGSPFLMLGIIWLGCAIHLTWTQLFMVWGVYQWHFVTYIPVLVIFYTLVIDRIIGRIGRPNWASFAVLITVLFGLIVYSTVLVVEKGAHHEDRFQAAYWVKENVPDSSSIALSDAGIFAYFNQHPTINLDGLINSYAFQEAIRNDSLQAFLKKEHVDYIADAYTDCDYRNHDIWILGYRGKNRKNPYGYRVTASKSAEFYSSKPTVLRPLTENKENCFVIWKMADVHMKRITKETSYGGLFTNRLKLNNDLEYNG